MNNIINKATNILANPYEGFSTGGIGLIGPDMPIEIFEATGRDVAYIDWNGCENSNFGTKFIESSFAKWTIEILNNWQAGHLDWAEFVVFSRASDDAQRLYYYICELQNLGELKGPKPVIFDVSKIKRNSSIARTKKAINDMCALFEVSNEALINSIDNINKRRQIFEAASKNRIGYGSEFAKIARATLFKNLDEDIQNWQAESLNKNKKIILAGNFPKDETLHQIIENAGANVAAETHEYSIHRLGTKVDIGNNPINALADHYANSNQSARDFGDRNSRLLEIYNAAQADAIIFWLTEEEEALGWELPNQIMALNALNIPNLSLTRQNWYEPQKCQDQINNFIKNLNGE